MRVCGTGCVGRVDRSSKISLTHHPRFSRLGHPVSCSRVCMRETRCAFIDTEAEVGTLGHLRIHVLLTSELPRVVKSQKSPTSDPIVFLGVLFSLPFCLPFSSVTPLTHTHTHTHTHRPNYSTEVQNPRRNVVVFCNNIMQHYIRQAKFSRLFSSLETHVHKIYTLSALVLQQLDIDLPFSEV